MSQQYQEGQRALAQLRQQQQLEELQRAQSRLDSVIQGNQNRFVQQQSQVLASQGFALAKPNTRLISLANASGVAAQSLPGTFLDAYAPNTSVGRTFFPTAGFSEAFSQNKVQERARDVLSSALGQIPRNVAASVLPDFIRRSGVFSGTSLDYGQEGTLQRGQILESTLRGIRGELSNTADGRGIRRTTAVGLAENQLGKINDLFGRKLDNDRVTLLTSTAAETLTTKQQEALVSGTGSDPLVETVKILKDIAKNTGQDFDATRELVTTNRKLGNSIESLRSSSQIARNNNVTLGANDAEVTSTLAQFTAQGRALGYGSGEGFAGRELGRIQSLIQNFNDGSVSRDELFRFGGSDAFEAAQIQEQRARQRRSQFADRNLSGIGVLGNDLLANASSGLLGTNSALAGAFASDPLAGLKAKQDPRLRQLAENNAEIASFFLAQDEARRSVFNNNPDDFKALAVDSFQRLGGFQDTFEAVNTYERLQKLQDRVSVTAGNDKEKEAKLFGLLQRSSNLGIGNEDFFKNANSLLSNDIQTDAGLRLYSGQGQLARTNTSRYLQDSLGIEDFLKLSATETEALTKVFKKAGIVTDEQTKNARGIIKTGERGQFNSPFGDSSFFERIDTFGLTPTTKKGLSQYLNNTTGAARTLLNLSEKSDELLAKELSELSGLGGTKQTYEKTLDAVTRFREGDTSASVDITRHFDSKEEVAFLRKASLDAITKQYNITNAKIEANRGTDPSSPLYVQVVSK